MSFLERIIYKILNCSITFSQCGEDTILSHLLRSLNKQNITYLDIGTNHPKKVNNTYLFYLNGATGVCVEPNPILCKKIKAQRPKDICLNIGVGIENAQNIEFYIMDTHTLSTFSKNDAESLQKTGICRIKEVIQISTINFNDLLADNFSSPPDIVSIDVEDLNEEIVKTINFNIRPSIFCIETVVFNDTKSNKKLSSIKNHFLKNNYSVYADTFINTIFVDNSMFNIITE